MRTAGFALLFLFLLFSNLSSGYAAPLSSALVYTLSGANNDTQTKISWGLSGLLKDNFDVSVAKWGAFSHQFDGAYNSSYFTPSTTQTFSVLNAGFFNDLTTSTSVQVNEVEIGAYGSFLYIGLRWGPFWFSDIGRQVSYSPGTDFYTINVPFSAFNPGTYTALGRQVQGGIDFSVSILPEPSSLSLLLAGGAVLMAGRRKK